MEFKKTDKGVCGKGFFAYGLKEGKYGLALIKADRVCTAAGVFTRNSVKAAHVLLDQKILSNGIRAVAANSGNANACVPEGVKDARSIQRIAARELGIQPENVAVASTGIIGRRIDLGVIKDRIKQVATKLNAKGSGNAARAIMTTDTKPKQYSIEHDGVEVGGICKGAGMIAPNMATMLCFITTNADLDRRNLQDALEAAVEESFNMITVDGDMSTNDTVLVLSTRTKKCGKGLFARMLKEVATELSKMIVRDGEGATKFIEFRITGVRSKRDAIEAAKAVANSPLVKTAFYGENPNWGRIIATIGSRIRVDYRRVDLSFQAGEMKSVLVKKGAIMGLDQARKILKNKEIKVDCNLNSGKHSATTWTCDLSEEYVRINAGYN
ncbi:MAG: bifunctional glutamate N-acetyltransferase/amino-acid acetyltransferase ArgJ [Candidatus Altiarchaeota archaeon]|nr:bifunctional glutamate N-acetyltransferase/amino-acid acetyltransferase ArgJ [Candidatus Altiarchaeota archaeon]